MSPTAYDILVRPVVTEDSTKLSTEAKPQYAFHVAMGANKIQIAKAVEEIYSVRVKSVNTLRKKGKKKTMRGRTGFRPDTKKAFVTLEEGFKLDLF